MRAIGMLLVFVVSPVAAEPDKGVLPAIVGEAQKHTVTVLPRDGIVGMFGSIAAAIIIDPGPHHDPAMVVTPPETNDPMALELGTNRRETRLPRSPWLPRDLSLGMKDAADKVWDVVLPKL